MRSPLEIVRVLNGGEHARTLLASCPDGALVVVRRFPVGDPAGGREVTLSPRLKELGTLTPGLIAAAPSDAEGSLLVTEYVEATSSPRVSDQVLGSELGKALSLIHALSGAGLRRVPSRPPLGLGPVATAAHHAFPDLARGELVLTHGDFWLGNTLWRGGQLVAVVDWSGAREGPRAVDLAWLRLDLILQGRRAAADAVVAAYEENAGCRVDQLSAWDLQAAAQAEAVVESWSPNYHGIGLTELTPARLRDQLDRWSTSLLEGARGRFPL